MIYQWLERVETFKNELDIQFNSDHMLRGILIILAILAHDCIFKAVKIFFFARYKPASLNFTLIQILDPIVDIMLVTVSLLQLVQSLKVIQSLTETRPDKLRHTRFTTLFMPLYPFVCSKREQQVLRYRRRKYADRVLEMQNTRHIGVLVYLLLIIPLFYVVFKYMACLIEFMMALATNVSQNEALFSKQVKQATDVFRLAAASINSSRVSDVSLSMENAFNNAQKAAQDNVVYWTNLFPSVVEAFKARTCVDVTITQVKPSIYDVKYEPTP